MNDKLLLAISVFIGVSLWLYVFSSESKEATVVVPVRLNNIADGTAATVNPKELLVRVQGSQAMLFRADGQDFAFDVDMEKRSLGRSDVRISSNDIRISGMDILEIRPPLIEINIAKTVKTMKQVEPLLLGQTAKGYKITDVKIIPEKIEVEGAHQTLSAMDKVQTKNVNISDISSYTVFTVDIANPDGIKATKPSTVTIEINVAEDIVSSSIYNAKLECMEGTGNNTMTALLPNVMVTLQGRSDVVSSINVTETYFAEVNCKPLYSPGNHLLTIIPKSFDKFLVTSVSPNATYINIREKSR